MIGKQDNVIEKIYNRVKHIIDDVYRPKGLSSESIRKYFLHKKNFRKLISSLKDLKFIYGDKFPLSFDDQVSDILFQRILKDRIYYEKDNPQNEKYLSNYNSFLNENTDDLDPYGEEEWDEEENENIGQELYDKIIAFSSHGDEIEVETNSGKWKFYYDNFDGCVNWWNEKLGISIYATPYYENRRSIPIQGSDNEGYQDIEDNINLNRQGVITLAEYINIMREWINNHRFLKTPKENHKKCNGCGKILKYDDIAWGRCAHCRWEDAERREDAIGGLF